MTDVPPGYTLDETDAPPAGYIVETVPQDMAPSSPEQDSFLDSTSVGRVLDAFGQGAKAGWGTSNVLMTPETEKALRDAKIFEDVDAAATQPLRLFNEAVIRPAAAALDGLIRGGTAALFGTAGAVAQAGEEVGIVAPGMKGRLTRDLVMMAETLGVVTMTTPSPSRLRAAKPRERQGVMDPIQRSERPEIPGQVFQDAELPPAVDKAGNINLDRINAPEDVKNVIREASGMGDGFVDARRGVMTLKETEELADAAGVSVESLTGRKLGQAFNAEEAVAARKMLVQSAEAVFDAARKSRGGTDADVLKFQELMTRHMAIQEQVAGLTAEAGRALSSFRILAQGTKDANALGDALKSMGGRETIEGIARRVTEFNSPEQVSAFLMEARKATTSEQLLEGWINGLLSGPQTHVTNVLSNTLVALWDVPETFVASGVSKLRGRKGADATLAGEAAQRLFGIVQGSMDGIRAGWRAFKTEIPSDGMSKLEQPRQRAIPSAKFSMFGREFEIGGKQVRLPGRLLLAEDEYFKAIGYRQELNAQAYAIAKSEGLDGRAFKDRMAALIRNPTDDMRAAAQANADYQTFTKELGKTGKTVQEFTNSHPLAKVAVPFMRTPANIFKYSGERTPLAVFSKEVRATLGGAKGARAADEQAARLALGSAVGIATAGLAAAGFVTGSGPSDPKERAVKYLTGWQPNSVRIGDVYYSFGRLEPLGTLMGISASAYELAKVMTQLEADKLGALVLAAISKNLVDKTWTQGPASLIEAIQDSDRYAEGYIRKLVGSVVPTLSAQVAREMDPILREAQTMLDAIRARVPGMSQDLLPRRDLWGEPIELEGGLGPDMISPIYQRRITEDRVAQELVKLRMWPTRLRDEIRGVKLTPAQYDEYQVLAGRLTKYRLDKVLEAAGPVWGSLPEFVRRENMTRAITQSRNAARTAMLARHPQILVDATRARYKEVTGKDMPAEMLPSAQ
jgi:hypothetical protein